VAINIAYTDKIASQNVIGQLCLWYL